MGCKFPANPTDPYLKNAEKKLNQIILEHVYHANKLPLYTDEEYHKKLKEIKPESITFLDPACGSGHILVEAYNVLKEIYLERGYRPREVPRLILEKNLYTKRFVHIL